MGDIILPAKRAVNYWTKSNLMRQSWQQIQCRAKTYDSLSKRLTEIDAQCSDSIEELRHDLSGCRIIFYFNDDVNAFLQSGIIRDNFKIDWDNSKIHGPGASPKVANDYYTANHYVVELSDDRLKLPEYSEFEGLRCEIQIQTVLNHAWSETAHDITYKKPDDSDFGKHVLDAIDNRLAKIMKQHLKPAGYEFQKIQRDHRRLLEGKKSLGRDLKQEIIDCQNNNERYEILERYQAYTLPLYDDNYIKNELSNILDIVQTATSSARETNPIAIETPFGAIPGKTFRGILTICLQIINYIRYVNVESVLSCLIKLYRSSNEESEIKLIKNSIEMLIKYNIDILPKAGFFVQEVTLEYLEKLDSTILSQIKEIVAEIGHNILDPSAEGSSSNYKSITIKRGSITGNKAVEKIRQRMLTLLISIYDPTDHETIKHHMISAFNAATQVPSMVGSSDELLALILKNCTTIINFYIEIVPSEQYEILESIESNICFLYRRSIGIIEGDHIKDSQCIEYSNQLIQCAINFRDRLNNNEEFVAYKTLVGFKSVFTQSWTDDRWNVTGKNEYREEHVQLYVEQITNDNQAYWKNIIIRCTQTKSNNMATFPIFCKFLNLLAISHSTFSFELIKDNEKELMPFSAAIFDGLLKSELHDDLIAQMNAWVSDGKYLGECARAFEFYAPLDEALLSNILKIACEYSDNYALTKLIVASTKNYNEHNKHLIGSLFRPAIEALTKLNDANWIGDFWFRPERNNLLSNLNLNEVKTVLSNLVLLEKIDFHAEEVLIPIAEKYPQEILGFFKQRIDIESNSNKRTKSYEAIPFNFHQLAQPLASHLDTILDTISEWYNGDYYLFRFRGAKLISNIFPKYTTELNTKLLELVSGNDEKNYRIVMALLLNYNGVPEINDICRSMISSLPEESDLLTETSKIMRSTGVLKGEFGLVNALQQKKEAISSWLSDSSPKVNAFASRYIADLIKQIINEQRRAEEDIELRKHQYGDDEDTSK